MKELYPLKFKPQVIDKMWGGNKLQNILNKSTQSDSAGESWELSGVEGNQSIVCNGYLEGNEIDELIEVYMGDIVGDRIFDLFGKRFPLLIKFIDANDVLSIQVHPDDEMAQERHNSFGKTEMWYVMQANEGAELIVGFNKEVNKEVYLKHLEDKELPAILNSEPVKEGDVFFLPAGRVHAIGSGILLAEIQQTSDVTYRIYDFERKDDDGNYRDLHTEEAVDAIDYTFHDNYKSNYEDITDEPVSIVKSKYFTTNKLTLQSPLHKDISKLDCFVIYMCLKGSCLIEYADEEVLINLGETALIPASLFNFSLKPQTEAELLEVYIEPLPNKGNS